MALLLQSSFGLVNLCRDPDMIQYRGLTHYLYYFGDPYKNYGIVLIIEAPIFGFGPPVVTPSHRM